MSAARYVELNPVRARLCARPEDWPWSSARAHLRGRDDGVARVAPLLDREPRWAAFLETGLSPEQHEAIRAAERTGRPLGGADFIAGLEASLGRVLTRGKPGRKPRIAADDQGVLL